jgi:hypothetical protein
MSLPKVADSSGMSLVLTCHPDTPCHVVHSLRVRVERWADRSLVLRYVMEGALGQLVLPTPGEATRADGLWRHTCCEAFVGSADSVVYHEFNFSPSRQWAAYRFSGYREGMLPLDTPGPEIKVERESDRLELVARLSPMSLPNGGPLRVGLCAVIEAGDGSVSYWALRHPTGRPDFHHTDAFALELP